MTRKIRYGLPMCGRFMLISPIEAIQKLFDFKQRPNLRPRYNIAPSQEVTIVRRSAGQDSGTGQAERELATVSWGLIPSWAEDPKVSYKMINARAETVDRLPSYRSAYRKRRCLIPTDGFFEWKADAGKDRRAPKQPYLIRRCDQAPFAFAGLYERWRSPDPGEVIESCTIVTTSANQKLSPIHHRMPVILDEKDHERWLDPQMDGRKLLGPCPDDWLETVMIVDRINKPAHDDPSVLEPIDRPIEPAQGSLF
ncbi:MAG: SOS response-associated peptidase [Geminicoccaceae bacterium]